MGATWVLCLVVTCCCLCWALVVGGGADDGSYDRQILLLKQQIEQHSQTASPPALAQLYLHLGSAYQQLDLVKHSGGDLQLQALDAYNKALSYDLSHHLPMVVMINYHKGVLLKMMSQGQSSVDALRSLLEYDLHPADESAIRLYLGDAYLLLGDLSKAIAQYSHSLRLTPCRTNAYFGYVQALREQNQLTRDAWASLVALLVERVGVCHRIDRIDSATFGAVGIDDPDSLPPLVLFSTLEQALLPPKPADALYSISYIFDKLGDVDQAYRYLSDANAQEKRFRGSHFDGADVLRQFENTAMVFHATFWDRLLLADPRHDKVTKDVSVVPVFVVGMMRSGSTLLESMLDSHSDVVGIGEESIFNAHLMELRDALVLASSSAADPEDSLSQMHQAILRFKKRVNKRMYDKVKGKVQPKAGKRTIFVVDKMLFNYRNIGFIHLVYPNAPILHIHRDPMDTLFSVFKFKFDDAGLDWSLDWQHIASVYELYLRYMHHFRGTLGSQRITDVRYEDMVRDPKARLQDVLESRLNVSFQDSVLEFYKQKRSVLTHSQSQVRQQLYQSSIGSWRKYAEPLRPVVALMQQAIARLREQGALAFSPQTNWDMRLDHTDYQSTSTSTEASARG